MKLTQTIQTINDKNIENNNMILSLKYNEYIV